MIKPFMTGLLILLSIPAIAGEKLQNTLSDGIPEICKNAKDFRPLTQKVWVAVDKAYFLDQPKSCVGQTDCSWKRKAFLLKNNEAIEFGIAGQVQGGEFGCIQYQNKTSGWMITNDLCLPASDRNSRNDVLIWPDVDHVACVSLRTIPDDKAYFTTHLETDSGSLDLNYENNSISYSLSMNLDACKIAKTGKLKMIKSSSRDGAQLLSDSNDKILLTDSDAFWQFEKTSPNCPTEIEFFYNLPGTQLSVTSGRGSSGCDLAVPGIDKKKLIAMIFKLKRAVRKNDKTTVSALVRYPFTGKNISKIKNAENFQRVYNEIFDECIKKAVLDQRLGQVFCRDQGVMFGNGELWISNDRGIPKVIAINKDACKVGLSPHQ